MAEPPLDTKGSVTPVRGSRSMAPNTFRAVWAASRDPAAQAAMVGKAERPTRQARAANTVSVKMDSTASTAMSRPHSSHSIPNTGSVSAAGMFCSQPLPAPMPTRPPEAAADMARVC